MIFTEISKNKETGEKSRKGTYIREFDVSEVNYRKMISEVNEVFEKYSVIK